MRSQLVFFNCCCWFSSGRRPQGRKGCSWKEAIIEISKCPPEYTICSRPLHGRHVPPIPGDFVLVFPPFQFVFEKARKWKKHAGQGAAGQPSSDRGVSWGRGVANGGSQQAEGRFASLLAKGNAEASGARRGAGIAGPWEPAPGPREVTRSRVDSRYFRTCSGPFVRAAR